MATAATATKPREQGAQIEVIEPDREMHPLVAFKDAMEKRTVELSKALPPHIPVERFMRVVLTALQNTPSLLRCTQQSLWNACMKAAHDGLLPDGRDGAIVPYGENENGQKKADNATWMPMINGLRKKVRNSGEIRDWYVEVVYAGDVFQYQKGDDPRLHHEPVPPSMRKQSMPYQGIIAAYSIAVFKDGTKSVPEVMWIEEIEGVRSKSKAKKGPWADPVFYVQMVKKTVARRHYNTLPQSTDLDDLMRRDDDLYDFSDRGDAAPAVTREATIKGRLDQLAGSSPKPATVADAPSVAPASDLPGSEKTGSAGDPAGTTPPTVIPDALENPTGFAAFVVKKFTVAKTQDDLNNVWATYVEIVADDMAKKNGETNAALATLQEDFAKREKEIGA